MKILLLGELLLTISFATCLEKREVFAENIRKNIKALTKPSRTDELVSGFQNKLTLLFYTLSL